jgi:hypothetical protein
MGCVCFGLSLAFPFCLPLMVPAIDLLLDFCVPLHKHEMKPGLEKGKGFTFNHLDQSIYLKIHVANQQQVLLAFASFNILCKNAKPPHMQKSATKIGPDWIGQCTNVQGL